MVAPHFVGIDLLRGFVFLSGFLVRLNLLRLYVFFHLVLEHCRVVGGFLELVRGGGEFSGCNLNAYGLMGRKVCILDHFEGLHCRCKVLVRDEKVDAALSGLCICVACELVRFSSRPLVVTSYVRPAFLLNHRLQVW